MDEHIIKLIGDVEYNDVLKLNAKYSGRFTTSCVKREKGSNQDGTCTYTYKLKLELVELITDYENRTIRLAAISNQTS